MLTRILEAVTAPIRASGRLRRPVRRIIAVVAGPNPSFDYYLARRLAEPDAPPVSVVDVASPGVSRDENLEGAFLIFCRYISRKWLNCLEAEREKLAGVGLFLDDDMDALAADRSVPFMYRLDIYRRALWHRPRFNRQLDFLWVANGRLARRYRSADPAVLPPFPDEPDGARPSVPVDRLRMAFHSQSVHRGEHLWLRSIMPRILEMEPGIALEVIVDRPLTGLWRGLPRTQVLAALPWPEFRAHTASAGADLLLAPTLPSPVNAMRSATKRIDAYRLGAALLVSSPEIYEPSAEERSLGMCVPPERQAWIDAVTGLARDPERLLRLRDLNRKVVAVMMASEGRLPISPSRL